MNHRTSEFEDIEPVFRRRDQLRNDGANPAPSLSVGGESDRIRWANAMRAAEEREKTRKRRRFRPLRVLLWILGILLLAAFLFTAVSLLFARMPESEDGPGPRKGEVCTLLLCGTDGDGTRTDTMMLLYLDAESRQLRLLSLPRDTMVNRENPVPKLNGAYAANGRDEKGMDVLMGYVGDLVGFRPDGYLLIELEQFQALVDILGPVEFDVPMDMSYSDPNQGLEIDLKAGKQLLDGEKAMELVRFRSGYAMADLERVKVQRDFLSAAFRQWSAPSHLLRMPRALALLLRHTKTDLSYWNLCWLGKTIAKLGLQSMESDTLPGVPATVNGGSYYVEDRDAAAALVNEKYNPFEKEITANDLHPYGY